MGTAALWHRITGPSTKVPAARPSPVQSTRHTRVHASHTTTINVHVQEYLALGSLDRSISVWPQGQPKPLFVLRKAFEAGVADLVWSDDGRLLVAVSFDGTALCLTFEANELGVQLSQAQVRAGMCCVCRVLQSCKKVLV